MNNFPPAPTPEISVIVPVHNASLWVERFLSSLLAARKVPLEVILVENASTDNSLEIIQSYATRYPFVHVLVNERAGVSHARNRGLDSATAPYILFLDADDYIEPKMISRLYDAITVTGASLSICDYIYEHEDGAIIEQPTCVRDGKWNQDKLLDKVLSENAVGGYPCNKLFRRDVIENNHLRFEESLLVHEDLVFVLQYALCSTKATYIPFAGYHYVQHAASATQRKNYKYMTSRLRSYLRLDEILREHGDSSGKYTNDLIYAYWSGSVSALESEPHIPDFQKQCRFLDEMLLAWQKNFLRLPTLGLPSKLRLIMIRLFGVSRWISRKNKNQCPSK